MKHLLLSYYFLCHNSNSVEAYWEKTVRNEVLSLSEIPETCILKSFMYFIKAVAPRCFVKKVFLKDLTKFTGKHLCWSLLFNKVAGLRPPTLLKKPLTQMFSCEFSFKFLRTDFL